MDYAWPGNVRELEHAIEHAFVTAHRNTITVDRLPLSFHELAEEITPLTKHETESGRDTLLDALKKTGWNKSKAARLLGINVRTIYRKIEKYNIKTEEI